ncbi:hypothetical protein [Frigoribacterium sp. SL97]|uniref:hypothetical protein n=1 Tax=Frigoribacterium sp. SL97 TaxID=2994664 RepID=UPI00226E8258|nr:hypothetical protein [Frigoribacterium sp. SL97]WAC50366.1 hypothetical protein OVA02_10725 [Frigoribacterium sp. SL97]
MTNFNENDHPRAETGKFADKSQSAPETSLITPARPRKPGQLGPYELKNYKRHSAGMEGGGFTASLYRDGKRVVAVSNDGNGGSHRYVSVTGDHSEVTKFQAFANKALELGGDDSEDLLIENMAYLTDIEKLAAKNGWDRDEVLEENLVADSATEYPLSERERAILRDPSILDD